MPARAKRLAPFSSARLAPSPDAPLTHFALPRGETCRLKRNSADHGQRHGMRRGIQPATPDKQPIGLSLRQGSLTVEPPASLHDAVNLARVGDVVERVSIEDQQIRGLARLD